MYFFLVFAIFLLRFCGERIITNRATPISLLFNEKFSFVFLHVEIFRFFRRHFFFFEAFVCLVETKRMSARGGEWECDLVRMLFALYVFTRHGLGKRVQGALAELEMTGQRKRIYDDAATSCSGHEETRSRRPDSSLRAFQLFFSFLSCYVFFSTLFLFTWNINFSISCVYIEPGNGPHEPSTRESSSFRNANEVL